MTTRGIRNAFCVLDARSSLQGNGLFPKMNSLTALSVSADIMQRSVWPAPSPYQPSVEPNLSHLRITSGTVTALSVPNVPFPWWERASSPSKTWSSAAIVPLLYSSRASKSNPSLLLLLCLHLIPNTVKWVYCLFRHSSLFLTALLSPLYRSFASYATTFNHSALDRRAIPSTIHKPEVAFFLVVQCTLLLGVQAWKLVIHKPILFLNPNKERLYDDYVGTENVASSITLYLSLGSSGITMEV